MHSFKKFTMYMTMTFILKIVHQKVNYPISYFHHPYSFK